MPGNTSQDGPAALRCQIAFIDEVGGSATERMRRPPVPPASFLGLSPGSSLLTLPLSLQHPCCVPAAPPQALGKEPRLQPHLCLTGLLSYHQTPFKMLF